MKAKYKIPSQENKPRIIEGVEVWRIAGPLHGYCRGVYSLFVPENCLDGRKWEWDHVSGEITLINEGK